MSDRKDKQLNNDDLKEVKSLIGDVSGDEFSLDDILAAAPRGRPPTKPYCEPCVGGGVPDAP